jgi:hypothetical protein
MPGTLSSSTRRRRRGYEKNYQNRFISFMGIGLSFALAYSAIGRVRGETMPLAQVEKTFGHDEFSETAFRMANIEKRASMAASLIKHKSYYAGTSGWEIRKRLGDYSGHYFSEMYPTYLIHEAKDRADDTWQLLFVIDADEKVKDIIVHKNCCDR